MLTWFGQLGWGRRPDGVDVDRLLRLEAAEARVVPPAGLRRRTLAALREASLQPAPTRRRPPALTYAAACGLLGLIAAAAAMHLDPGAVPPPVPEVGRARAAASTLLNRIESPLKDEVRLLVADARLARDSLLACLPRPPRDG